MKLNKSLCSLHKDSIKENLADVIRIVSDARFICRKCARVSHEEQYLCKPVAIDRKKGKRD